MNASVRCTGAGLRAFITSFAGMTSVDTSAAQFDPSLVEPKGRSLMRLLAPIAIGLALVSALLTFVVLTGLTRDRADPRGRGVLHPDERRHHPGAGRHHLPRSLAGDAGAAPRPGRGTAPRSGGQPVLDHGGAAGRAGGDRRQRYDRTRPRSAVFRPNPPGDPEFADHCAGLYERTRSAHSRRYHRYGERYRPCPAALSIRIANPSGSS